MFWGFNETYAQNVNTYRSMEWALPLRWRSSLEVLVIPFYSQQNIEKPKSQTQTEHNKQTNMQIFLKTSRRLREDFQKTFGRLHEDFSNSSGRLPNDFWKTSEDFMKISKDFRVFRKSSWIFRSLSKVFRKISGVFRSIPV